MVRSVLIEYSEILKGKRHVVFIEWYKNCPLESQTYGQRQGLSWDDTSSFFIRTLTILWMVFSRFTWLPSWSHRSWCFSLAGRLRRTGPGTPCCPAAGSRSAPAMLLFSLTKSIHWTKVHDSCTWSTSSFLWIRRHKIFSHWKKDFSVA